jgi:uncharacterized protein (TIGR02646 family)
MRDIVKGQEPVSLSEHRARTHSSYDNYQAKQDLRETLVREQRRLCCYCLGRIRPNEADMKIEHWHSQTHHPAERLTYSNLLGACKGGEKPKPNNERDTDRHCDTFKGDKDLSRNPANPLHHVGDLIRFLPDGRIAATDATFNQELSSVLNLNNPILVNNRKALLTAFKMMLPKRNNIPTAEWETLLRDWNGEGHDGELAEYCSVVVYWIRKRLR